jgi:uncharacterized protein
MAMRNGKRLGSRRAAIALAIAVVAALSPLAAHAQFFGTWDDRARHQGGGFFPFFDHPYNPQQPQPYNQPGYAPPRPEESSKAPPPRKLDTQPASTIVVIGDSFADWLAYGLEEIYADQPQLGVERRIRPNSGLIHYEPRNDALEWSQAIKDILATEKPAAIVVMLGLNDRVPLKVQPGGAKPDAKAEGKQPAAGANTAGKPEGKQPAASANTPAGQAAQPLQGQDTKTAAPAPAAGALQSEEQAAAAAAEPQRPTLSGTYEFHTDEWAELYGKRIDDMIAVLKSKGVPVLWVGLPAVRGPRATGEMSYLDDLYHARADKAGIVYVDVWDGFVDENGRYAVQGPDFEGQIRRLRSSDGVHFSKAGAEKLAHYVEHELTRVMANPVVPVALPVPEAAAPAAAATPGALRPAIGPVLPLAATGTGEGGDLLGAGARASPASPDPTAASVLVRGEALAAPAGRADNFTWPPSSAGAPAKPAQKAASSPPPAASTLVPAPAASSPAPAPSANAPLPAASAPAPAQAATPAPAGTPAAQ